LSSKERVGRVPGLTLGSRTSHVGISDQTSQAAVSGLQTGDRVLSLDGIKISFWRGLEGRILDFADKDKVSLEIERAHGDEEKKPKNLKLTLLIPSGFSPADGPSALTELGIEKTDLFLANVIEDSPAAKAGIRKGDKILQIGQRVLMEWEDLVLAVKSYKPPSPDLKIKVLRDGIEKSFTIKPKLTSLQNRSGAEEERYTIGIQPWIIHAPPVTFVEKTRNPIKAVWAGTVKSWEWTEMTFLTFIRIFQSRISPKNIGGVISIAVIAKRHFEMGISEFLTIMGIISINLFILNLLPIPVLDGGHLVFFSIEALRGAPISLRKLEIAQQVGLFVILLLIAYALMNDFGRLMSF